MSTYSDVNALSQLSESDLDILLGEAELDGSAGAKTASEAEKLELGRLSFSAHLPLMRKIVCEDTLIASLFATKQKERNDLIIAVAGLLSGISPVPFVLAARVLHYGYGQLCPAPAK